MIKCVGAWWPSRVNYVSHLYQCNYNEFDGNFSLRIWVGLDEDNIIWSFKGGFWAPKWAKGLNEMVGLFGFVLY